MTRRLSSSAWTTSNRGGSQQRGICAICGGTSLAIDTPRQASEQRAEQCELTILMLCLDEAETLAVCIMEARATWPVGESLRSTSVSERGYGSALLACIAAARGRYVIMGISDACYDFSSLDLFVEKLRAGYQLVMGNRFLGGIRPGTMPLLHEKLARRVAPSAIPAAVQPALAVSFSWCRVRAMRLVIPSGTAILLAFQIAHGAFFLSVREIRAKAA